MNKFLLKEIQILTGEIPGFILTNQDMKEKTQKYSDQLLLTREEFLLKYSPFHNPHLRLTLSQIDQYRQSNLNYALRSRATRNLRTNLILN